MNEIKFTELTDEAIERAEQWAKEDLFFLYEPYNYDKLRTAGDGTRLSLYRTFTPNLEDYKGPLQILNVKPDGMYDHPGCDMVIAGPIISQESNQIKLSVLTYMPSHGCARKKPRKPAITKK